MSEASAPDIIPTISDHLKTYKDTVPLKMLTTEAREMVQKEHKVPVEVEPDLGVRLKVLDTCGHACVFCHNEGTDVNPKQAKDRVTVFGGSFQVEAVDPDDPQFVQEASRAKSVFGIEEIHLTGGEPTQHQRLADLIRVLNAQGLTVKMTSNGESGALVYPELAKAGLKSVSISIFGSTPEEYAATQPTRFNSKWAANKLRLSQMAIAVALENGIRVNSNCVMSGASHADRIARLIDRSRKEGFNLRILNELGNGDESIAAIYNFLADLGATPIRRKLTAGASGAVTYFQLPDGLVVGFKQIRKARLPAACKGCDLDAGGKCEEGYYGMRLYKKDRGPWIMGVCIQRMDLAVPTDAFYASNYPQSIMSLRKREYEDLTQLSKWFERNRDIPEVKQPPPPAPHVTDTTPSSDIIWLGTSTKK